MATAVDRHKKRYTLLLPDSYRAKLRQAADKNRRTILATAQIAIDAYLKKNQIDPPRST